ncbi:hypothetical protein GCM10027155_16330 [Acinetobacter apis]|uniref:SnoaL-like polyketide cyclase n=1 Tax=Acinetobacter apis TaxID=1229165 RepID=A0A217EGY9_9GAMM|nr:ester cyclase [Acinetobacter apis]SNQ29627.1 conserved hypothetical protein, steroid delta-isomerase-related [Acinetobacter apis]
MNNDKEVATVNLTAAESASKQLIDSYMAEWNNQNAPKAATYLTPDVQYFDAAVGSPLIGQTQAQEQVIQVFLTALPDFKWEMISAPILNKDGIAFEWRITGTNTGVWGTEPATNKPISFTGVSFIRIHEGKITYQGDYYDAESLNKQLS